MQTRELADGRTYELYVPRSISAHNEQGKLSIPTIVAMHGALEKGEVSGAMARTAGLNLLADKLGFAVIYPHAHERATALRHTIVGWNAKDSINLLPSKNEYDDTETVRNMIADVKSEMQISSKVGLIGHSDGGRMGQLLAMRHPNEVAAVVPITSTWVDGERKPNGAVPMYIILGDKDSTLPYNGGMGWRSWLYNLAVKHNSDKSRPYLLPEIWSEANKCRPSAIKSTDGALQNFHYSNCEQDLRVTMVKGGGHPIPDWRNSEVVSARSRELNLVYDSTKWLLHHIKESSSRPMS